MDINTGALFVMDDVSNDVLKLYKKNMEYEDIKKALSYDPDLLKTSYDEIIELEEQGLIFTEEERPIISDNLPSIKAMCINIAHDCNMSCEYCFASKGDFGSTRKLMDAKTGKKAIDFLKESEDIILS